MKNVEKRILIQLFQYSPVELLNQGELIEQDDPWEEKIQIIQMKLFPFHEGQVGS
jgi:hypothetical protein